MKRFARTWFIVLGAGALAGCDLLEPRVSDEPGSDDADGGSGGGSVHLLPPGSEVPSVAESAELSNQIRIFDGLDDDELAESGGVVERAIGKAAGAALRYWSFGPVPMEDDLAVKVPVYLLVEEDGEGGVTPVADHPLLIDSIPGDVRYSPMRQIVHVPVTSRYGGEIIPSVDALAEALGAGLVEEPRPSGTWRNMPVVATGTRLEVGGAVEPAAATEVLAHGYRVELFPLGWEQPLRRNRIPVGHGSWLMSGVPIGDPPALPAEPDPQPVFQYGVPDGPPGDEFNYTPLATEVLVRLASGVAPEDVDDDGDLFTRDDSGGITGHLIGSVASYQVGTTTLNLQVQLTEGSP